ncbi:MFS general substrate transporter [Hymenopellis radicata]|nr:MFS general substrate transporter [Hymenopellis radicata]
MSPVSSAKSTDEIELATRTPLPSSHSTLALTPASSSLGERHGSDVPVMLNESSLAPVDGGIGAWSFLLAAFFVEAIVWGFPAANGIFLDSYLATQKYSSQPHAMSILPVIGPLGSGTIYCSGIVLYPLCGRYPYHRRTSMWVGVVLAWASLFAASYMTNVVAILFFEGGLYGVAGSLLYAPCMSYLSEWFVNKRGMANGVVFAGTAVGGLIIPLTLPQLIQAYGLPKTIRIFSVAIVVILAPLLPLVRPRIPDSRTRQQIPAPQSKEWMKNTTIWIALAANTLQGFGYFVPIVWLPTFARELHVTTSQSALTVAFLNGASVFGRLSMGYLSDVLNPFFLAISTLLSTSLVTFIVWGLLSRNLAGLLSFGIAYGMLAGGWSSLWTGFVRPVAKENPSLNTTLFGYFLLSRGLGNILSTPISSGLLTGSTVDMTKAFPLSGGKYENMIIYVGTCFAGAAGISLFGWALELKQRVRRSAS